MTARGLAIVLACAACPACGDNLAHDEPFTAVSGTRLALQKYRYDDGTEQTAPGEFYDTQLHVRCTPRPWTDGIVRCVPVADDAVYVDPGCTALIGLGRTVLPPTHFVNLDARPTGATVAQVFRPGADTAAIAQYYTLVGGACAGPTPVPAELTRFFALGDELDRDALVTLRDAELGDDRLALQLHTADDGLRVAFGLRDRALDVACTPRLQGDGSVACEPVGVAAAGYFRDAACGEPVVAAAAPPRLARLVEPSGCARYHRIGPELAAPVYRRDGDRCVPVTDSVPGRLFSVADPVELPALARALEAVPGRRLQRILLDHAGLRFVDDRLFDTRLGAECQHRNLRDAVRCIPANVVPTTTLFPAGCTDPVRVVELPQPSCDRPRFATSSRPFQLRPIAEPTSAALFRLDGAACLPYAGAPGAELRDVGAPIDLTSLPSAIYYSERAP